MPFPINQAVASRPQRRVSGAAMQQGGFIILEAIIAILVFALGILGLVGLQATMTGEQTASKIRADAAYLASELIGSMWVDVANLNSYSTASCASYTRCKDWLGKVGVNLPAGTAAITVNATTGDVSIEISWTLPNGDGHKFTTATTIVALDAS